MLKSTGIVRNFDALGRICIPIEIRRSFGLIKGAAEIFIDGDQVVLKKYSDVDKCRLCGSEKEILKVSGVPICGTCAQAVVDQLGGFPA